jgi:hypothetical protein
MFTIKLPLIAKKPELPFLRDLKNVTPKMISTYGKWFKEASLGTNVPLSVLYAMAMVESTGNHYTKSGTVNVTGDERSVGIMQISPASLYETFKFEIKRNRLSPQSQAIIKKYLPNFKYTLGKFIPMSPNKSTLDMFFEALKNPEFNIWASSIVLRRLLEDTAQIDGTMRLDKAIVKYNVGEYSRPTKTMAYKLGDTTTLIKSANLPIITKYYIVKAVGIDGAMMYFRNV